jgi:hypothetical protein
LSIKRLWFFAEDLLFLTYHFRLGKVRLCKGTSNMKLKHSSAGIRSRGLRHFFGWHLRTRPECYHKRKTERFSDHSTKYAKAFTDNEADWFAGVIREHEDGSDPNILLKINQSQPTVARVFLVAYANASHRRFFLLIYVGN